MNRFIFECDLLLYLAEKFGKFLPEDTAKRTEVLAGSFGDWASTILRGGYGHFFNYAPRENQ